MPKVTITFNLPEEAYEHQLVLDASKTASIVEEFSNLCREKTKHGDGKPIEWEEVKNLWWDIINDENYDPYGGI